MRITVREEITKITNVDFALDDIFRLLTTRCLPLVIT